MPRCWLVLSAVRKPLGAVRFQRLFSGGGMAEPAGLRRASLKWRFGYRDSPRQGWQNASPIKPQNLQAVAANQKIKRLDGGV